MKRIEHPLLVESLGSQRSLTSFHFGPDRLANGSGKKVYLQASLHAEELPGMVALHHLLPLLAQAEEQGQLRGQVVVVPVANPIGLAQRVDHKPMGRFELASSENFNRHYPDLATALWPGVKDLLTVDRDHNVQVIRDAALAYLQAWQPATQLQSLRRLLTLLAVDADVVLDLHCDCEAAVHLYAEDACWLVLEPLSRLLGARAVLLAQGSGGLCFDECLSGLWWQLAQKATGELSESIAQAIAQGCASTTVELRGEGDVTDALGLADAKTLFRYLVHLGVIDDAAVGREPLPVALCQPTPLAGAQPVKTPVPGAVVFVADIGDVLKRGDVVAYVINPCAFPDATRHPVLAEVDGVMYARTRDRYALANDEIANIAGSIPFRSGPLLGY